MDHILLLSPSCSNSTPLSCRLTCTPCQRSTCRASRATTHQCQRPRPAPCSRLTCTPTRRRVSRSRMLSSQPTAPVRSMDSTSNRQAISRYSSRQQQRAIPRKSTAPIIHKQSFRSHCHSSRNQSVKRSYHHRRSMQQLLICPPPDLLHRDVALCPPICGALPCNLPQARRNLKRSRSTVLHGLSNQMRPVLHSLSSRSPSAPRSGSCRLVPCLNAQVTALQVTGCKSNRKCNGQHPSLMHRPHHSEPHPLTAISPAWIC